jgi:hypothetical protein
MRTRGFGILLACVIVLAAVAAPGAFAGKPTMERVDIDDTFADDFLTEECGVPVTAHVQGHITLRTFEGGGTGPADLTTVNFGVTVTAGDNSYRFRNVGADLVRIEPDGTAILMIIGQVPFQFTGVLKIDLETEEPILEPQHTLDTEEACAALTA